MQHFETVLPVSDVSEQRGIGRGDHHVFGIVQLPAQRLFAVDHRATRPRYIDDHQAFALGCDIGIGSRDIDPPGIGQRHGRFGDCYRVTQVGHVKQFEPVAIGDPQIAELDRTGPRIDQFAHRSDAGFERIGQIDHDQSLGSGDIGNLACKHDVPSPGKYAIGVPRHCPLQPVVAQLAVGESVDVDQDQSFDAVGNRGIVVDRQERLLLVRLPHQRGVAFGRNRLVGRQRHAGGVGGINLRISGERRGNDRIGKAFVGHCRHIVDVEAALPLSHKHVFAA